MVANFMILGNMVELLSYAYTFAFPLPTTLLIYYQIPNIHLYQKQLSAILNALSKNLSKVEYHLHLNPNDSSL